MEQGAPSSVPTSLSFLNNPRCCGLPLASLGRFSVAFLQSGIFPISFPEHDVPPSSSRPLQKGPRGDVSCSPPPPRKKRDAPRGPPRFPRPPFSHFLRPGGSTSLVWSRARITPAPLGTLLSDSADADLFPPVRIVLSMFQQSLFPPTPSQIQRGLFPAFFL